MRINEYINVCLVKNHLFAINDLLANANCSLFMGSRIVTVHEYDSSMDLDDLVQKILQVYRERCLTKKLTTEERLAGTEIMYKLRNFYIQTDQLLENVNPLVRLINKIRECTQKPKHAKFYSEEGLIDNFFLGGKDSGLFQELEEKANFERTLDLPTKTSNWKYKPLSPVDRY